jgi:hypothetical protein
MPSGFFFGAAGGLRGCGVLGSADRGAGGGFVLRRRAELWRRVARRGFLWRRVWWNTPGSQAAKQPGKSGARVLRWVRGNAIFEGILLHFDAI